MSTVLRLDTRSQAGLRWLKAWVRCHITRLKRARKYSPRGGFDPAEADPLRCLFDLERSADRLLKMAKYAKSQGSGQTGWSACEVLKHCG